MKTVVKELQRLFNVNSLDGIVFEKLENIGFEPNLRCMLHGKNVQLYVEDGFIFTVEYDSNQQPETSEEPIGTTDDLMLLPEFEEFNQCIHCKGEGMVMDGPSCDKPASMCCGGCYHPVKCECELPFELSNY